MKSILYLVMFSIMSSVWSLRCTQKYHFWRPFIGEHSDETDYIAGRDIYGKQFYIGKIISPIERRAWTFSTLLLHDYVNIAFEDHRVFRVDRCIEILSVEPRYQSKFDWYMIRKEYELDLIQQYNMCYVLGGLFRFNDKIIAAYIGRYMMNGTIFIGPVFTTRWTMEPGMHFLDGYIPHHRKAGFQILTHRS